MGSKILLVEADPSAGAELRAALADASFAVTLVRDGQLGLARAVSEQFDAVIVSAELPGINGFRLCNRMRKDPNVSGVRVFIVGAEADDLAAHERLPTRADSYFEKPLVVAELIARMRLHGVGGTADDTLRAEIVGARKELAIISELQQRVNEQEALIEATSRELAKARADLKRSLPPRPMSMRPGPTPAEARAKKALEDERAALQKQLEEGGIREKSANAEVLRLRGELARRMAAEKKAAEEAAKKAAEKPVEKPTEKPPEKPSAVVAELERRLNEQAQAFAQAQSENKALEADAEALRKQLDTIVAREWELSAEVARAAEEAATAQAEAAKAQAVAEEALRVERQSGLAAVERVQREWKTDVAARDEKHAQDLVLATHAIAKLRKEVAERDQRLAEALAAAKANSADEAAENWANERAVLEERLRMAEAHDDETAMTVVAAHAEIENLKKRLAAAEAQEAPTVAQVKALEASLVSRTEAVTKLEIELDEAHQEVPALEAEIVVLRSELMNLRRQLDTAVLQERTSDAQLERGRDLLERAEALVGRREET